jgi:tetratricopeptide (TPR) repeat protein
MSLAKAQLRAGELETGLVGIERARELARQNGDSNWIVYTALEAIGVYSELGNWKLVFETSAEGLEAVGEQFSTSPLYTEFLSRWGVAWAWAGRYLEAEERMLRAWALRTQTGDSDLLELSGVPRDLAFALGFQGKFASAFKYFSIGRSSYQRMLHRDEATAMAFEGAVLIRQGRPQAAQYVLRESWNIKQALGEYTGLIEVATWLGQSLEFQGQIDDAEAVYHQGLEYRHTNRRYFECTLLVSLLRIACQKGQYEQITTLHDEAVMLAQHYEYNDHLAVLCLMNGHVAWMGELPDWGSGFDAALDYYKQALIYALRYNRFLLDEVMSGRPEGTPLQPIIQHCLQQGEEGKRMLQALLEWWRTGINDTGTPRPDTISPIQEGITLLEAERLAREREPGDGQPQRRIEDQVKAAVLQLS